MSYLIEYNRYLYRHRNIIFLIQKVQNADDAESKRFNCKYFTSLTEYWLYIGDQIVETVNLSRQRGIGWTKTVPFTTVEYARIYESKLRNAKPLTEIFDKFKIYRNGLRLDSIEEVLTNNKVESTWHVEVANYFTTKGAL